MARNMSFHRRLRIERLERRELLCSGMSGTAGLQAGPQIAAMAVAHVSKATRAGTVSNSSNDEASETHLFATLTDANNVVVGTAAYETEVHGTTTTQELSIKLAGAAANATYSVTSEATILGTLTTDANGNGYLELRTTTSATTTSTSNATAKGTLPAGFTLAAGATIDLASTDTSVAPLNGSFATAAGDIGSGDGHDGQDCQGDRGTVTRIIAQLSNGTATDGKAVFTTITHADGTIVQILRVRVAGVDANATLPVSVDGTPVGSIMTDANGNGRLILSSNPQNSNVGQLPGGLTITSTSTITIGTSILGTFNSSSTHGSASGVNTGSWSTATASPMAGFDLFSPRRRWR